MDEILEHITPPHWFLDFRFLLEGAFRGTEEGSQIALLEDRLETRYAPHLIPRAYNSLKYSYNWLARNWGYFEEVGMVRREGGRVAVENSLVYALYHFSSELPLDTLPMLPEMPPETLVPVAQKYIDSERTDK